MAKSRRVYGTGHVYRPCFRAADGSLREQKVWWVAYRLGGKLQRESAETTVKNEAEALLRGRIAAVDAGTVTTSSRGTTLADLRVLVVTDYEHNGRRSVDNIKRTFTHLEEHFGADRKAASIDAAAVQAYKADRLKKAMPATVNRELASLRRGFRLAVRYQKLAVRPDFSLLTEKNARRGFFQHEQIADLLKHSPDWLSPLITFLFTTGWRRREATGLEWRQVDRKARVIRIEDTKTNTPRTIPYGALPVLVKIVEGQWKRTQALKRAGVVCPYVFHRDGRKILDFRQVWHEACRKAGIPGRIVHDFRRSAAREMLRAGIPQNVAMMIGGWKTDSVFRRYAIVDENLLAENLAKLAVAR